MLRACRSWPALALLAAWSTPALAQPGATPPAQPQPQPAPPPAQPQPAAPPPQPQPQPAAPPPAQPQPQPPYPYPPPPQPYPYAYPPPQPYPPPPQVAATAPPPAEEERGLSPSSWASAVFFFHGLCPDGANPMCSGGIWMGFRGLYISGDAEEPVGLAADLKAGFGFGFGFEVKDPDPMVMNDRESAAHVLSGAEIGVGPGLRLGAADIVPILGVGADALAYGFTGSDDEATSEAFWYAAGAIRLHLGDVQVLGTAARQYRDRWDRYADRIEVGATWKAEKKTRVGFAIWWLDYDRFTIAGGGIVAAPGDQSSSGK
ncbi:MAG TPA: hypothetical protein VFU21_06105 [Kofleriaceae bacterium]|nr:hypothetical protein [Kofleriaceae bacterium]